MAGLGRLTTNFLKSLDQISYLLFQLKTLLYAVAMILKEFTILILVSSKGFDLDFSKPLHKFFVLDLYKHLGLGD